MNFVLFLQNVYLSENIFSMSGRNKNRRLIGKSEVPQKYLIGGVNDDFFLLDNLGDENPILLLHSDFPVRSDKFFCVHVVKGVLVINVGVETYEVRENQMFILLPGSVFQTIHVSADMKFYGYTMTSAMADKLFMNVGFQLIKTEAVHRFYIGDEPYFKGNERLTIYNQIKVELKSDPYKFKDFVLIRGCEILVLKDFSGYIDYLNRADIPEKQTNCERILRDFLLLLEQHHKVERSIKFYATQMKLTPKYLSTSVKIASGKTCSKWVEDYVVLEAKMLLKQGVCNVGEISKQLNFPTQSMFGRFFKQATGITPKKYKEEK